MIDSTASKSPLHYRRNLFFDLGLDQLGQFEERFLPAEVAHLRRNHGGDPLLLNFYFGPAGDLSELNRIGHLARQIRIVELIRVLQELVRFIIKWN